ncbi:MAG TPA: polysaccharide deacetylase family protein [Candidatus Bathyarchaeia archaeon]|nr:polysaccharide deacetylase family protein [Candidatus Bathyarchaeia archaeon]
MVDHRTRCTIVQYHYVRKEEEHPKLKGLMARLFAAQLDYIMRKYEVVSLENYVEILRGACEGSDNLCVLTFDDGLKDHYANAFPILREKGLTASFFPMTQPLTEHILAPFHKVHLLLAELGSRTFADQYNFLLKEQWPELYEEHYVDDKVKKNPKYKWDDTLTANLKVSIGSLPSDAKQKLLGEIFEESVGDEQRYCDNFYMNADEMREMQEAGMSFGSHTHSHPMLARLSLEEQRAEIKLSKRILEQTLKQRGHMFSYPYGDFNETTISILKSEGYSCGVTTDFDVNVGQMDPYRLKRLDTNDVPFG